MAITSVNPTVTGSGTGQPSYTGSLTDSLPKFLEEARLTLSQTSPMREAVRTIPLPKGSGLSINIPTWSQPTAYTLTEGVDMSQVQEITDTNVYITVAENAGVQVMFTRLAMEAIREDAVRMAARMMANSIENKRGDDLVTLLDGFSTALGSNTTALGLGHILAAKTRLQVSTRPVEGPIQGVFHPYNLHDMLEDMLALSSGAFGTSSPLAGNNLGEDLIRNFEVFDVGGVRIFADPLIPDTGSTSRKGGVFAKEALIYVPYDEETIETEYNPSLRATEVNMVATYGYGEYEDTWGFEMEFDAATAGPTA